MPTIIINGACKAVEKTHLTYQEIVDLADSGRSKSCLHSIIYSVRGQGDWYRDGTVTPGSQPLELAEGMIISAMVTDNA